MRSSRQFPSTRSLSKYVLQPLPKLLQWYFQILANLGWCFQRLPNFAIQCIFSWVSTSNYSGSFYSKAFFFLLNIFPVGIYFIWKKRRDDGNFGFVVFLFVFSFQFPSILKMTTQKMKIKKKKGGFIYSSSNNSSSSSL